MPTLPHKLLTIRNSLLGELTDFATEAGFSTEVGFLAELVYQLASYREEDVALYPSVYVTKVSQKMDPLSVIAPGTDRVFLRNVSLSDGAGIILKDCAGLSGEGWSVFVEINQTDVRYGLFRSEILPVSVSSYDSLADADTDCGQAILLRNCAKNCVELVSGKGQRMEIALTSSKAGGSSISEAIANLSASAVGQIEIEERQNASAYLERLFSKICQRCHGTIIMVVNGNELHEMFRDGVILEKPIDLIEAYKELRNDKTAASLAKLESREALLRGMINSDGITILSSSGQILAFRVFIRPLENEREKFDALNIRGGSRSRAHELAKLRLGEFVRCVFFRSQDGHSQCSVQNEQ